MSKLAFITGITGQDGSYLAELLLEKDYDVWGIIRRSSSINTGRIDHLYHNKRLTLRYGDLSDGCTSSCSHFNPFNTNHGGRHSKERHVGDLGNVISKNKLAKGSFHDKMISLDLKSKCCIVGRCIVVHADRDDLGKGGDEESLKTGNAGKRLACGVIGLSKKKC